ncbi:MAG: glutaredoxin family protein [Candidatus Sulfobium sp.]|jgi:glutaredoxin-like protein NrdH
MTAPVKMYTLSTCIHCRAAKKFLENCGVEYEFRDVDLASGEEQPELINEVKKFNPRCTFPTIIIGNKIIVGFREEVIREALGL